MTDYVVRGWYGAKTLWSSTRSYRGPLLVRGRRLDAPGPMAFGERPTAAWLISGPGSSRQGWPGATWVRASGCYGFQVDLSGTSYSIVVQITASSR